MPARLPPSPALVCFCLTVLLASCAPLAAQQKSDTPPASTAPMVAGFERFGRHGSANDVAAGRLLLTELSCTACHAAAETVETKGGSGELKAKGGPDLRGVASRLQFEWLKAFLADPNQVKPGTTMPDLLHGLDESEERSTIDALSAFLATQTKPFPEIKASGASAVPQEFWKRGDLEAGRTLYHRIGCVACHAPADDYETVEVKPSPLDELLEQLEPDEIEELGLAAMARPVPSVPLPDLRAKYSTQGLTHFLLNPHAARPAGRMPRFELNVVQAADLTAWLMHQTATTPTAVQHELPVLAEQPINDDLVANGRRLFVSLGCANCHSAADLKPQRTAPELLKLDPDELEGCLRSPIAGLPAYPLDNIQREHLATALIKLRTAAGSAVEEASSAEVAQQAVRHSMLQLNCYGCHERDERGGVGRNRKAYFETVGNVDIGDEGRLPPALTAVGRKLKANWLKKVFDGTGRLRPFMRIQMPAFPSDEMATLSAHLARADHVAQQVDLPIDPKLADAGRQIFDVGCVQCHPLRNSALPGVIGIDLQSPAPRLQPTWFHEFLLDPASLKPRTRMPTFFKGGVGQLKTVLDGDADRQIDALWSYLNDPKQPLPERIQKARSQNYELVPKERPIVLRTFMKQAGTHAIAVGFPENVHLAFDAEQIAPAFSWRGRFLDALGTWFVRFAPPAEPLGGDGIHFPPGPAVAQLSSPSDAWPEVQPSDADLSPLTFGGYRLDQQGVPTFLYRLETADFADRLQPEDDGWHRTISVRRTANSNRLIYVRLLLSTQIEAQADHRFVADEGLSVQVNAELARSAVLRETDDGRRELLIPLPGDRSGSLEMNYRW